MAVLATLALLFAASSRVCCVLLAAFIGSLLYMVVLHHRLKEPGLAPRARRCWRRRCRPTPSCRTSWSRSRPSTRARVLRRGVEAAARLDWPRDKLHIQVLDDSTDETAELARTVAAELQAKGFDVVALQRTDRSGYKGGALHEAMQKTPHDYFAIFDVDYVPPPDFLRRCMRPFFAEPQGRLRAGPLRFPQSARECAHRDADGDARRPSRHRAGDALLGRPSAALQRHLRHLAARRDRGRRRLEGRHRHRGSRSHLSRLGQGLARAVPDQRRRAGRAAGRHQDLAAPAAALAGRLPPCLAAHVPGDPEEPRHHAVGQGGGAAASLHVAEPAGAAGRRRLRPAGGAAGAVAGAAARWRSSC